MSGSVTLGIFCLTTTSIHFPSAHLTYKRPTLNEKRVAGVCERRNSISALSINVVSENVKWIAMHWAQRMWTPRRSKWEWRRAPSGDLVWVKSDCACATYKVSLVSTLSAPPWVLTDFLWQKVGQVSCCILTCASVALVCHKHRVRNCMFLTFLVVSLNCWICDTQCAKFVAFCNKRTLWQISAHFWYCKSLQILISHFVTF